jgi:hypothetical protein
LGFKLAVWRFDEGVVEFRWLIVIADLLVGTSLAFGAGLAWQAWRRRRYSIWRFSLIELLLLLTGVAVAAGILTAYRAGHRRELAILAEIEKRDLLRATAHDPFRWTTKYNVIWRRGGPSWMRELFGEARLRIFDRVEWIEVDGAMLDLAVELRHLKAIYIEDEITNRHFANLSHCRNLEAITVSPVATLRLENAQTASGDEEFLRLPLIPKLRAISLYGFSFRGEGLDKLPALEHACLAETEIDRAGLRALAKSADVRFLDLSEVKLPSSDFVVLASMTELRSLRVIYTEIDDASLAHLARLRELRELSLTGTRVTDASLPILKGFERLENLDLPDEFGEEAKAELQRTLPNCKIW